MSHKTHFSHQPQTAQGGSRGCQVVISYNLLIVISGLTIEAKSQKSAKIGGIVGKFGGIAGGIGGGGHSMGYGQPMQMGYGQNMRMGGGWD